MDMYSLKDELALRRRLLFRLYNDEARRTFEAIQARERRIEKPNGVSATITNAEVAIFGESSTSGEDSFVFR